MKMNLKVCYVLLLIFTSTLITSCSEDTNHEDSNNPNAIISDPDGTMSASMKKATTIVMPPSSIPKPLLNPLYWLNGSNGPNMYLSSIYSIICRDGLEIADVGLVNGLGNIQKKPISGWSNQAAEVVGNGYVVRIASEDSYTYGRFYIVRETSEGIQIKYQYPF